MRRDDLTRKLVRLRVKRARLDRRISILSAKLIRIGGPQKYGLLAHIEKHKHG